MKDLLKEYNVGIAYFSQVDINFKLPCIIENPYDTMAGGIAIKGIRKGVAIEEEYDDCEGSYYNRAAK